MPMARNLGQSRQKLTNARRGRWNDALGKDTDLEAAAADSGRPDSSESGVRTLSVLSKAPFILVISIIS